MSSNITFISSSGTETHIEADGDLSVMRAATGNNVDGIIGECGGQMMCSTCHVYVSEDIVDDLPPISEDEEEMLELTSSPRLPNSRLSCQIKAARVDGQILRTPETQL